MILFWTFIAALIVSAIGFKKYVWFISIGYGFAIAGIGVLLLILFGAGYGGGKLTALTGAACALLILYGCRLGGYLSFRELKVSNYNNKMKGEIVDGKGMSFIAKAGIWIAAAALYMCQASPLTFRLAGGMEGLDPDRGAAFLIIGMIIMLAGVAIETAADLQKNEAKKKMPGRFVDTGLYRMVRCPNYFGEMLFWTGVLISGIGAMSGALQWIVAILGYLGIIYVMFGGARRLEERQNRSYGNDPEYIEYVRTTPIMIPLIPLYSVEKYKWFVA